MSSTSRKRPRSKQKSPSTSIPFPLKEPASSLFPSKQELPKLFAVVAIAASVAIACNYTLTVFNRQPKPFCDSDEMKEYSLDPSISDFCERCPSNGKCSEGQLECLPGYKKHRRICIEDGEINQIARRLSEWIESHVCEAYARCLCDGTGTFWFQEAEILNKLDEFKLKEDFGSKNDTFVYIKQKAIETIESSLETRIAPDRIKELKCPDWLVEHYKPLLCRIRQWIHKHAVLVFPVFALFVWLMKLLWRIRQRRYLSTRAEELYQQVCDMLEENALLAKTKGEGEPWVVASRIRDHLLLPRERKDMVLWRKVEELVQEDSRLDQYPKLVKGESKVVWEWQVEGSLSSKKGTKGAVSKIRSTECMHDLTISQRRNAGKLINS